MLDGSIPVANIDDAILRFEPIELSPIMKSPLLKPDKKIYKEVVEIESADGQDIIIAKDAIRGGMEYLDNAYHGIAQGMVKYDYVVLRLTNKTTDFSQGKLRIGQSIVVVGKYVENKRLVTASGPKTIPVLDVMYVTGQ